VGLGHAQIDVIDLEGMMNWIEDISGAVLPGVFFNAVQNRRTCPSNQSVHLVPSLSEN